MSTVPVKKKELNIKLIYKKLHIVFFLNIKTNKTIYWKSPTFKIFFTLKVQQANKQEWRLNFIFPFKFNNAWFTGFNILPNEIQYSIENNIRNNPELPQKMSLNYLCEIIISHEMESK